RGKAYEANRVWDRDVAAVYAEHDVDEVILGVGRWPGIEAKSGFELVLDSLPLAANDGVPIDERDMVLVRDRLQHVQIESVLPQFVVQKDHVRAVAARQPDHLPDVLAIIAEPDASPLIELLEIDGHVAGAVGRALQIKADRVRRLPQHQREV